jgi:drug/metabolite transporter (DMT)-like permease
MPFYIFAWIADLFWGVGSITGKLTSKHHLTNPWLLNFAWGLFGVLLLVPVVIINRTPLPTNWWPILLVGVCYTFSGTLYILALSRLDISILSPMYSLRSVFAVLLGAILFAEHLTHIQVLLVLVVFIGGLLVSMDEKLSIRSFFRPTVALALSAVAASAVSAAAIKNALQTQEYWAVNFWGNVIPLVLLLPTIPLFWKDFRKSKPVHFSGVVLLSVFSMVGALAANRAFATNIGISSTIIAVPSSMILAFLFSVFAPKLLEKHTMKVYAVRFAAAAVMIAAALKLSA